MYHEYTQEELRQYCRNNIETLEIWARRLIHEKMVEKYGNDYVNKQFDDGNYLVKSEVRKHINGMIAKEPSRFSRPVDTLFIDQIVYFLCHPVWYKDLFKSALDYIYPQGKDEAREYLNRLVPIRNPLSHSNPITMHDVERAICYSHDFIKGLKKYYKDRGEEQVWNVPQIIKVTDSLGNVFDAIEQKLAIGVTFKIDQPLSCGDTYSVEIEVDTSFDKHEYDIYWAFNGFQKNEFTNRTKFTVFFTNKEVGTSRSIWCWIVSKKDWHKYGSLDSKIQLLFTVLPPNE